MKAVIKKETSSKGVKKGLTSRGVKVFRCSNNGKGGLLITVEGSVSNIEKAVLFFTEFNLTRIDGGKISNFQKLDSKYPYDFGNVYHTQTI